MFVRIFLWLAIAFLSSRACSQVPNTQHFSVISYYSLLQQAIATDEVLVAWAKKGQAAKVLSANQQQWADPQLSFALSNIPTQGSMFRQEPMTQIRFGVQQQLPRGRSLDIKQNIEQLKQQQAGFNALLRQKQIKRDLANHYLQWYLADKTQSYIKQNLEIVTQWVGVLSAHYGSGKHKLQDVVAAQVEQSRLQLLLTELEGQRQALIKGFAQWQLSVPEASQKIPLPKFQLPLPSSSEQFAVLSRLQNHPQIQLAQLAVDMAEQDSAMAKQALEPQFAVNASVAVRQEDRFGTDRADLFSLGLTMSQPLFNRAKQDDKIVATELLSEGKNADKRQLLQQYLSQYQVLMVQVASWQQQHELYQSQLLTQLEQQLELALAAYNNDSGEFDQLLKAYVALMNGRIDIAKIEVKLLALTSQLIFLAAV